MSGPHDRLVRFTFGHPERAAAELRAVLPAHVVSQVDWYGRSEQLARRLVDWETLFTQAYRESQGSEDLLAVLRYLLEMGDDAARGVTVDILEAMTGEQRAEEHMSDWFESALKITRQKFMAEGRAEGLAEGLAGGRAEDVLQILALRGVPVDDSARQRILSCRDLDTLGRWLERAVSATRLSDVLDDLPQ